jgi:membrane associated rhomboid family serine protease
MTTHTRIISTTNILIAITIVCFVIQNIVPDGSVRFGLNLLILQYPEVFFYQLLSTMFTHGGIEHLLMNMIVLWQFGNLLEEYMGKFRFLLLYFIGGILTSVGTLIYMVATNDFVNVVGASGAISVIMGYFALKSPAHRQGIIIWMLAISFLPLLFGMGVAWYSHLIGFALGFILGLGL